MCKENVDNEVEGSAEKTQTKFLTYFHSVYNKQTKQTTKKMISGLVWKAYVLIVCCLFLTFMNTIADIVTTEPE